MKTTKAIGLSITYFKEEYIMALSNLNGWVNGEAQAIANGTACGAGDEKPAACGSACGAGDK